MERSKLRKALKENRLWDFLAEEYPNCSNYELKEIIFALLGVMYDNCTDETDINVMLDLIDRELEERDFFEEEDDWEGK